MPKTDRGIDGQTNRDIQTVRQTTLRRLFSGQCMLQMIQRRLDKIIPVSVSVGKKKMLFKLTLYYNSILVFRASTCVVNLKIRLRQKTVPPLSFFLSFSFFFFHSFIELSPAHLLRVRAAPVHSVGCSFFIYVFFPSLFFYFPFMTIMLKLHDTETHA